LIDFNKKVVFKIPIIEEIACQEIIPAGYYGRVEKNSRIKFRQ
jgi:hypothetical protein